MNCMTPTLPSPSNEDFEELLLSCRYGELDEVKGFVDKFGCNVAATVRDENGNTVLHMVCGNGHNEVLDYLLTITPPELLSVTNNLRSTPLHWATTNKHLETVQRLVQFPQGPGPTLIDQRNLAGLTAVGEAEMVEWDEGAKWLVSVMRLKNDVVIGPKEAGDEDEDAPLDPETKIDVEVEDVNGNVAKMRIGGKDPVGSQNV
ncbi:hypothetical protein FRB94_012249 [Tulasnella sp. JGI-2019a]|nr:hypothetical protein FRB93_008956 [Tulasnella sp. JGI-2019a]KAG9009302.1 hypothetical protein FRB94_012249 [Tulasnella sp. JGI-2019a]